MKRFTQLYMELDGSNRKTAKLAALKRYFSEAPAEDAAWAVFFLTGQRLRRPIKSSDFREWAGAVCGFSEWMVETCYGHVGDLAETLALLLPEGASKPESGDRALHEVVEGVIVPLREMETAAQRQQIVEGWAQLDRESCFVFNKLITGGFRVGVSQTLVSAALADLAEVAPAVMAHRLMGDWTPTAPNYHKLFSEDQGSEEPGKPYPFCLAHSLDESAREALGPVSDWQIEWKWDGIRAQLIKRGAARMLWSRGEELITEQFPEIIEASAALYDGVVLDGELLVWDSTIQRPAPFSALQRRLGRKKVGPNLLREAPVIFMAYDVLESAGGDLRGRNGVARRACLSALLSSCTDERIRLSPQVETASWEAVAELRASSRSRRVEGLMLKRKSAPYFAGRKKGDWWKWKVEPFTVDAVLVYAQQGHGRRAGLYTDYTFSVWQDGQLLPIAKAYSGLSDAEIRKVDRWIRQHTVGSHGPVRVVDPQLVFEIAFEGIAESKRHKSGVAVRFPRILRWRVDKGPGDADTLAQLRSLLDV